MSNFVIGDSIFCDIKQTQSDKWNCGSDKSSRESSERDTSGVHKQSGVFFIYAFRIALSLLGRFEVITGSLDDPQRSGILSLWTYLLFENSFDIGLLGKRYALVGIPRSIDFSVQKLWIHLQVCDHLLFLPFLSSDSISLYFFLNLRLISKMFFFYFFL